MSESVTTAGMDVELRFASAIRPTHVNWLWPQRIALGKVTLLVGDPGLGKSLLTLDMAARVSRGANWPDEEARHGDKERGRQGDSTSIPSHSLSPCLPVSLSGDQRRFEHESRGPRPASVILLSAEDDVADTIRPRLDVHGADCERIVVVSASAVKDANGEYRRGFDLGRDLVHLDKMLEYLPECRLVVIDPIVAYLGRCIENTNTEVRGLLGPLTALATARNLAVVAVTHLRKKEGATLYRALGSLAFMAASRAAWIVCSDPTDGKRRLLLPLKNNLAGDRRGLAYRIESWGEFGAPRICWEENEVTMSADMALSRPVRPMGRPNNERRAALDWLERLLTEGPQPVALVREAAEARGFAYGTVRKAFRALQGVATRIEGTKEWQWQLPVEEAA